MTFPLPVFSPLRVATVSLATNNSDAADLTTYTFNTQAFGDEAPDRYLIIGIFNRSAAARTLSSVTLGGVSASAVTGPALTNGTGRVEMWIAKVPTGTTGTVTYTYNAGALRTGFGLWRATGIGSTTPFDTGTSNTEPGSDTLNIPARGFGIGFSMGESGTSATWTGLTEFFDATVETRVYTGAHANFKTAQSALSVTCDYAAAPTQPAMVLASWGP